MSEEILEQTAPAEKKGLIQKILENKLLVFLPAALVLVAIALGYFADILSPFLSGVPFRYLFKMMGGSLLTNLVTSTFGYFFALLLPVAVIVAKKINKPMVNLILLFAAAAMLLFQLLCVLVSTCMVALDYGTVVTAIKGFFGFFRGSEVLTSLYYMIQNLFSGMGFGRILGYLFRNGVVFCSELLFLLKNVVIILMMLPALKTLKKK